MIHANDCGNCEHWIPWTAEEWETHCQSHYDKFGWSRPEHRYEFGWCDKIKAGTPFEWDDSTGEHHVSHYDGYSFSDECYDDDFHCFEEKEVAG